MREMKLKFIADPGHGWLEVPFNRLRELGITNCISQYSYYDMENKRAYLEEDCDAGIFIMAAEQAGIDVKVTEDYQENTFVRRLSNYPFMKRTLFDAALESSRDYFRSKHHEDSESISC